MNIKEEKAALRAKMKAQAALAKVDALQADSRALNAASLEGTAAASLVSDIAAVLAFVSMRGEPDTASFFSLALKSGKTLLLPRMSGKSLDFIAFEGDRAKLLPGRFGVLEPAEGRRLFSSGGKAAICNIKEENLKEAVPLPALILVPGIAFDRKGGRLGHGAGFYDRFLRDFSCAYPRPPCSFLAAGFCFHHQIIDEVPMEETDFPMDCLILPDGSIIEAK